MSKWENLFGRLGRALLRGGARGQFERNFAPRPRGDSFAGQAARVAFRLFKDNCVTLPWIEEGAAIDAAVDGARADLLRSWNVYHSSLRTRRGAALAEGDWQQVLTSFRRHVADLNRRIAAYNLKAPSAKFRRPPVDAEREISTLKVGGRG
ncbi:MAG TPA: hypothetical protein VE360_01255 [Pyrinomonadaceae bacterium]|jgi:hypothetical protein|nr:hypothetical protein [Pyrinomonadaceae bacterium]